MTFSLGLLCFVFFVGRGYSLSCTECIVQGAALCTGSVVICPPEQVCARSYTINREDGVTKSEFSGRTCSPETQCQGPGSFSTYNSQAKKGFSCCYTDNCVPPQPVLSPDSTTPNGVICPTCTANGTDWCDTGITMKCTGEETRCILQHTNMSGTLSNEVVLRGCATPTICNIGNQSVITDGLSVNVRISCTGGSSGLYPHVPIVGFMIIIFSFIP